MKHLFKYTRKDDRLGRNSGFRRIVAMFFCVLCFAIMLFPASPYADAETPGTVTFAKWTKVKSVNDLPRSGTNYIFIAYHWYGPWYCWPLTDSWTNGDHDIVAWKCSDHSEIDAYDYTADVFYTKKDQYGSVSITYRGWDCNGAPEYYFKTAGGKGSWCGTAWDNDSFAKGNHDDLCIAPHADGGSYKGCAREVDSCGIYRECNGNDAVVKRSNNIIYLNSCDGGSDYSSGDFFYIWLRSEIKFDALPSTRTRTGTPSAAIPSAPAPC